jgi:hypothetical protein
MRRVSLRRLEPATNKAFHRRQEPGAALNLPAAVFEFYTPPGTFFDVLPIHVLGTSTLQAMATLNPSASWDARRFRPNIVVQTGPEVGPHVERDWVGRTVRVGGFAIRGEIDIPLRHDDACAERPAAGSLGSADHRARRGSVPWVICVHSRHRDRIGW